MRVSCTAAAVRRVEPWKAGRPLPGLLLFRVLAASGLFVSLLLATWPAFARTWRVARDGSGDFETIQPAVDGAAPGDTIFIAAGRYAEHSLTMAWGPPEREACVVVSVDSLTLIGENPETVVIGPEEYVYADYGPIGIGGIDAATFMRVENVGLVNNYAHIYKYTGTVAILGCHMRDSGYGVCIVDSANSLVMGCFFEDCLTGVIINGDVGAIVRDCEFRRSAAMGYTAIEVMTATDILIEDCLVAQGANGIGYDWSTGVIRRCRVGPNGNYGIDVFGRGTEVVIEDCVVTDATAPLCVDALAALSGNRNVFRGGRVATLVLSQAQVTFRDCHILNGGNYSVHLADAVNYSPGTYDLTGNWWGTTDSSQIDAWIYDANDEPQVGAVVQYQPVLDGPVPTKAKSWGELKALFR